MSRPGPRLTFNANKQPAGLFLATYEALIMLRLALLFLVIALVAALFGFGLVAHLAFDAAKILFFVFLVLAVITLLAGWRSRAID